MYEEYFGINEAIGLKSKTCNCIYVRLFAQRSAKIHWLVSVAPNLAPNIWHAQIQKHGRDEKYNEEHVDQIDGPKWK